MRVAWVFSGQPRLVERGHNDLSRLIRAHNSTVFAHFWSSTEAGERGEQFAKEIETFKQLYKPASVATDPCEIAALTNPEFREGLTPRSLVLLDSTINLEPSRLANSYFMFDSWHKSMKLVSGKFDIVVKCRTDCQLRPKGFGDFVYSDPNLLYTVGLLSNTAEFPKLNDILVYGSPKIMFRVSDLVQDYWTMARISQNSFNIGKRKRPTNPLTFESHTILYNYCVANNIPFHTVGGTAKKFCWRYR